MLPVLPDFECWGHKYVHTHFDNDPTEEVEALSKLPPAVRIKVCTKVWKAYVSLEEVRGWCTDAGIKIMAMPHRVEHSMGGCVGVSEPHALVRLLKMCDLRTHPLLSVNTVCFFNLSSTVFVLCAVTLPPTS